MEAHDDWVFTLAYAPDGRWLVSGAGDGTARVWDVSSGAALAVHHGQQNIAAIRFSPSGRILATTAADGTIFVRDAMSGHLSRVLRTRFGDRELSLPLLAQTTE